MSSERTVSTFTSKQEDMKVYAAAILGGTGSVGKGILRSLLADSNCQSVVLVSRRPLDEESDSNLKDDRVKIQICNPIEDMATKLDLKSTNISFCTLGIGAPRKVSKEELYQVDCVVPSLFAELCAKAGVTHYCVLSAAGADASSTWSNFTKTGAGGGWYNYCKGVMENNTEKAGFPYVFIAQAGTLLGSPHTPSFLNWIPDALIPAKYSSAHVDDIADGMVRATVNAYQNDTSSGVTRVSGGIPISKSE